VIVFDRKIFFDSVRASLFGGTLSQQQVDGMNFKLARWELSPLSEDLRHLAYPFATAKHETASTMWPIEEYGKGKGKKYGQPDPRTGKTYYGRGDVQLTWYDNYLKATVALNLPPEDDLTLHPEKMLEPSISAAVMYLGMSEGWFRGDADGRETLKRYFNADTDDPYGAREIINGDKHLVPKWSGGVSIGDMIKGYHFKFHDALKASATFREPEVPIIPPETLSRTIVRIEGDAEIWLNGVKVA
jgi:hypothetical protein